MDPVRELPYWPAAVALLIEAGQMTASDYVPNTQIYCLHPMGRPQTPFSRSNRLLETFRSFSKLSQRTDRPDLGHF